MNVDLIGQLICTNCYCSQDKESTFQNMKWVNIFLYGEQSFWEIEVQGARIKADMHNWVLVKQETCVFQLIKLVWNH